MAASLGKAAAENLAKTAMPADRLVRVRAYDARMSQPPPAETERRYRPLQRGAGMRLMHCQCRAAKGERPVDEEHQAFSITLVERGQFTYRTRTGGALLGRGWLMLGNAGEGYACSHEDSDGTGDDCTVLSLSPALLEQTLDALGAANG